MGTATLQGYHDFIIKSDFEFATTFKTESGLELHADSRFSADRLANRIATVLDVPKKFESCEIEPGYEVVIDPTIYYRQQYEQTGSQENNFMIDRQNGIFKIAPEMILLYRETPESEWKGYGENLAVVFEQEEIPEVKIGEIIVKEAEVIKSELFAKVVYSNSTIDDVTAGDKVIVRGEFAVPFWIEGKEYSWINNRHVLAKID